MRSKEQIKIILQDCDFKMINSVMKFLNKKWTYENGENKVPSVADLMSVAEYCLNKVADSPDETIVFSAACFEAEKINNILELRVILERVNPLSPILNINIKNELARKT